MHPSLAPVEGEPDWEVRGLSQGQGEITGPATRPGVAGLRAELCRELGVHFQMEHIWAGHGLGASPLLFWASVSPRVQAWFG